MLKYLFSILIVIFSLNCHVFADEQSHRAVAEELLILTGSDKSLDQVWLQLESLLNQQFQQMDATGSLTPVLNKYTKRLLNIFEEVYNWDTLKNDFVDIYVKTYTEKELLSISQFYKTPAGRKYIEKLPQLIQESIVISQNNMPLLLEKTRELTKEMQEEIARAKQTQTD